jgi:hypothetical protein
MSYLSWVTERYADFVWNHETYEMYLKNAVTKVTFKARAFEAHVKPTGDIAPRTSRILNAMLRQPDLLQQIS